MILLIVAIVVFFVLTGAAKPKLTGEAPPNPAAPTLSAEQKAKDEWNGRHTATREDGREPTKSAISAEDSTREMWLALNGSAVDGERESVTVGRVNTLKG